MEKFLPEWTDPDGQYCRVAVKFIGPTNYRPSRWKVTVFDRSGQKIGQTYETRDICPHPNYGMARDVISKIYATKIDSMAVTDFQTGPNEHHFIFEAWKAE